MEKFLLFRKIQSSTRQEPPTHSGNLLDEDQDDRNSRDDYGPSPSSHHQQQHGQERPLATAAETTPEPEDISHMPSDPLIRLGHTQRRNAAPKCAHLITDGTNSTVPWIEYSILKDSVYCFACRHFGRKDFGFHKEQALMALRPGLCCFDSW